MRRSAPAAADPVIFPRGDRGSPRVHVIYSRQVAAQGTHADSPMYPGSRAGGPASSSTKPSTISSEAEPPAILLSSCRYRASGASIMASPLVCSSNSSSTPASTRRNAGARSTTGQPRRSSRHRPRRWSGRPSSMRI